MPGSKSNRFLPFFYICHQAKLSEIPHELLAHKQEQLLYVDESWMQLQDSQHEGSAQLPYEVRMLRDPPSDYLAASMSCQVPYPIVSMLFTYMLHQVVLYESRQSVCAHEQER